MITNILYFITGVVGLITIYIVYKEKAFHLDKKEDPFDRFD